MSVTHRDRIGQRVAGPADEVLDWLVRQRAWELRLAQLEGATPTGLAASSRPRLGLARRTSRRRSRSTRRARRAGPRSL